jgi:putative flippase GtrA
MDLTRMARDGWQRLDPRLFPFAVVGAVAALVHLTVAIALLWLVFRSSGATAALTANALAFGVAFLVSYAGQRRWTFRSSRSHGESVPRYLLVALGALALNELVVALAMRLGVPGAPAIVLGIAVAAAMTFTTSRSWVFAHDGPTPL